MKFAILLAMGLAACSPAQHRAYQYTMGGAALAGFGTGTVITYDQLTMPKSSYRETRPTFGMAPVPMLATFSIVNVAVVAGIKFMPDSLLDHHTPWVKDVLMTAAAVMGVADGYGDYMLTR